MSHSQIALFTMTILIAATGILLSLHAIQGTTRPLREAQQTIAAFSQGDLSVGLTYETSNEIGTICGTVCTSQDILGGAIEDIAQITKEPIDDDPTVGGHGEYLSQLIPIKTNIEYLPQNLDATTMEILNASDRVSAKTEQVPVGSRSLAQGATE